MGVYSIDFHYITSTSNLLSLWKTENWNPNDAKMRKRKERQERQGWWWKRRKARRWKRQVELCSTSDHISSCHTESTNSTSSLFFCSFKFWSWFLFIWNNWTSTCWCCRDRASTCWCFDIHLCSTRWTTTYSSWRTEPTWCKSTSKQERNEEIPCSGWRSWCTTTRCTTTSSCSAQASWSSRRWGFMEAVGKRHIMVFIWMLYRVRGTISFWMLCWDKGIRWAAECFFISHCTDWSGMWERTSFSHREFCTTNCMYPGSWMHKSYGLSTSSWSILQICWLTSQQWTRVWNSANKFKILLCKFPTIQVHWE